MNLHLYFYFMVFSNWSWKHHWWPGVTLRSKELSSEIVENRKRLFIMLTLEIMTIGLHSFGWYISFLGLPEQNLINLVAQNNRNSFSYSSESSKSEIKGQARLVPSGNLWRRFCSRLLSWPMVVASNLGIPWFVDASLEHLPPSPQVCLCLCFLFL